ncbi:MAG TPA: shikimate kinase [Sporichthya sp.]|nr:shikimate kinase [Sporichthya sp.]
MQRIALVGLMGSGKTTVGWPLAQLLGWNYRDNDRELFARFGATAAQLADRTGLKAVHAAEAAVLLDLLAEDEHAVISAAASTIESAACRRALRERAFVVWLRAEPDTLSERATTGAGRPWEDDIGAQLRAQASRRYPFLHRLADLTVDTTRLDPGRDAEWIAMAFRRQNGRVRRDPGPQVPGRSGPFRQSF